MYRVESPKTQALRNAFAAAQNARQAAKATNTTLHTNFKTMKTTAADMIKSIKNLRRQLGQRGCGLRCGPDSPLVAPRRRRPSPRISRSD